LQIGPGNLCFSRPRGGEERARLGLVGALLLERARGQWSPATAAEAGQRDGGEGE
jgi:hypothetical protein